MINFFRKHSSHLKTNWFNYGLDTLVVIIGILIALTLNNWNDARKSRNKEITLLTEMKRNLNEDLDDMRYNIATNKGLLKSNEIVLHVLENSIPFHDSLRYYYGNIFGNTQLSENTSAYDNLLSIGFDLIKNDELRGKITRLYSMRYEYITNIEQRVDDKFMWERLHPHLLEKIVAVVPWNVGVLKNTPRENAYPVDQNALFKDHEFKEVLKFNIFIRKIMISEHETLKEEIIDLIYSIENEISN